MQSSSLGSELQSMVFLHLKQKQKQKQTKNTSKENRVVSRKRLFRENMTLSML